MTSAPGPRTWRLLTPVPTGSTGAIACVRLDGPLDTLPPELQVEVDRVALRPLLGVDQGLVARPAPSTLLLFPHAGPAVTRALLDALTSIGWTQTQHAPPTPARTIRDRVIERLPAVPSRLGVELLLKQPERWSRATDGQPDADRLASALRPLLDPPTVVAIGPPNVGKSTLLNALAGQSVAIVADAPGTTRDHVGARLDLGGITVRYIDTPGIDPHATGIDREAQSLALEAAHGAELLLWCADATASLDDDLLRPARDAATVLRVTLRADLWPEAATSGGAPGPSHAVALAPGRPPVGLGPLIQAIRERLVPVWALDAETPWRFWDPDPD